MQPQRPDLIHHTRAERTRLVDMLGGLEAEQWDADSLCDGWRVREVVVHMTMPFRLSAPRLLTGIVRARLNFARFADRDARKVASECSDTDSLSLLRANIDNPWTPPGAGEAGALSHDVIHGLDITIPLGLPGPPVSRVALVLASTGPRNLAYFGVDLEGTRLVATDADVSIGDGVEHHLSAVEMLLVVTARRDLTDVASTTAPHAGPR